jgi:hypothetical protein
MPPVDNDAPKVTVEGLDILARNRVAVRNAKKAERDEHIRAAARLMREIDDLTAGLDDLADRRWAVMMGDRIDTMVDLRARLAPFVGHA